MTNNAWRDSVLQSTGIFSENEHDLKSIQSLVTSNAPTYLYRFRAGNEDDLDALKRGYEWLSYAKNYNDPFDARIFIDKESVVAPWVNKVLNDKFDATTKSVLEFLTGSGELDVAGERADQQVLKKAKSKFGINFKTFEKSSAEFIDYCRIMSDHIDEKLDQDIRSLALICSFTAKKNNYLMWAHYSDSHKGYCLEYKFPGHVIDKGFVLPVSYRKSPVDVTHLVQKSALGQKNTLAIAAIGSSLVKGDAWEYENEWRYICYGSREGRELNGLVLNRVLLGCNASDELKAQLVNICRERQVELVKLERSPSSFELVEGESLA